MEVEKINAEILFVDEMVFNGLGDCEVEFFAG